MSLKASAPSFIPGQSFSLNSSAPSFLPNRSSSDRNSSTRSISRRSSNNCLATYQLKVSRIQMVQIFRPPTSMHRM